MSEDKQVYSPCPLCGGTSIAQLAQHICRLCEVAYQYCPHCGQDRAAELGYA